MRSIWNIVRQDFRGLTGSVVGIVILVGLIVVPCLFAWFNIFSNWAPFVESATGRVPVAVASEDEGVTMLGLEINVGDKFLDAIAGNNQIKWVQVPSEKEARKGVRAGDYYAAIVVPKGFSADVMSFSTGTLHHPRIHYIVNEKMNAIAPRITDSVRATMQEEIDAAFVETLGKFAAEGLAVADAAGFDPQKMFSDMGKEMETLSADLATTVVLVKGAAGLSDAAEELLKASDTLLDSTEDTLAESEGVLKSSEKKVPKSADTKPVTDAIQKEADLLTEDMDRLSADLKKARTDLNSYNQFVEKDLARRKTLVDSMKSSVDKMESQLRDLNLTGLADRFARVGAKLASASDRLGNLTKADEASWAATQKMIDDLLADLDETRGKVNKISGDMGRDLDGKLNRSLADARASIAGVRKSLSGVDGDLGSLEEVLSGSEKSLRTLENGLGQTVETLSSLQNGCLTLGRMFDRLANSGKLKDMNNLLVDDAEAIAKNLARPIRMETKIIYPVEHFGSVMASFYTTVALWIGALLATLLISSKVNRREEEEEPRLYQRFFGRFRLFMMIGICQALLVAVGELLYVGIDCVHPWLYVLAAAVISVVFCAIIYSIHYVLGKMGLALCVVILVVQVAGGGGSFPVEVVPRPFQILYPFMPFHYAMDAMRECIAGMYGTYYIRCLGTLLLFAAGCFGMAFLLYRPLHKLMEKMESSMEESGIM